MAKCSVPDIQLIITCEHASNGVPEEYEEGIDPALNVTHRGYDIGAYEVAKRLAAIYQAPLLVHKISRLLVDVNRSSSSRSLFVTKWPYKIRQEILAKYYLPYRQKVHAAVDECIGEGKKVLHFSVHSFTPILANKRRDCDIGLLYDPKRGEEKRICHKMAKTIRDSSALLVRYNYPYRGDSDGLVTTLRKAFAEDCYIGIEIECSQKLLIGHRDEVVLPLKYALEGLNGE